MSLTRVVPEGSSGRIDSSGPVNGTWHWFAAAVLGILAAATLAIGEMGGVDLSNLGERRLIHSYLDAWYGGDFDSASHLRAPQRLRTGPSEERAREEVAYQALLGAGVGLGDCERLPPATFRCEVAYSNALSEAVDAAPAVVAQQFGINDGLLMFVAGPYLHDEVLTGSFRRYAATTSPAEYEAACVDEPNYQPVTCAEYKLRHLEEWADWHRSAGT